MNTNVNKLGKDMAAAVKSLISRAAPTRFGRGDYIVIEGIEGIVDFRRAPHRGAVVLGRNYRFRLDVSRHVSKKHIFVRLWSKKGKEKTVVFQTPDWVPWPHAKPDPKVIWRSV